jgi:endonuclease YncB( thermonuclease family)
MVFLLLIAAFRFLAKGFVLILVGLICASVWWHWQPDAMPLRGVVVEVLDGDTVALAPSHKKNAGQIIRLASIDTPAIAHGSNEPGQPYSELAKRLLTATVLNKLVTLHCYERDQNNRSVCDMQRDGESVNRKMVAAGLAWVDHSRTGLLHDLEIAVLERSARVERRGIWSTNRQAIPPWIWRRRCWQEHHCERSADLLARARAS